MRYSLCLSYDGSAFCGWQIQPSSPSVQACLEGVLFRLLGRKVPVTGAGRTDTGVHAVGYIAHFDYDGMLPFEASDFTYKLNAMLPREVVVHSVSVVPDDFHARFSARRREYTYFIHRQKDPFLRSTSWLCGYPSLDFDAMNAACQFLLGTHDFSCFEKTGGDNKTSICTVFDAFWAPYTPSGAKRRRFAIPYPSPWVIIGTSGLRQTGSCGTWCGPRWERSSRWGGESIARSGWRSSSPPEPVGTPVNRFRAMPCS